MNSLHQIYISASTVPRMDVLNRYSNPAFSFLATRSSLFNLWLPRYATLTLASLMLCKHLIFMGTINPLCLAGGSTFSKEALINVCACVKIYKVSPLSYLSGRWPSKANWTSKGWVKLILHFIHTHTYTHTLIKKQGSPYVYVQPSGVCHHSLCAYA